ncbi:hypothetical protein A3863_05855 [Priestia endophytica]|nr:hypothetical protein A3863_05855 [Priestia endophytica]
MIPTHKKITDKETGWSKDSKTCEFVIDGIKDKTARIIKTIPMVFMNISPFDVNTFTIESY